MNIISWIKGKKKKREVSKYKKDEDFEFEMKYYGETDLLLGFNFIYCNNYNKIYDNTNKNELSFISCSIILPYNDKNILDLTQFMNIFYIIETPRLSSDYNNIHIEIEDNKLILFLRGNINLYKEICDNIHNNIITRFIRNSIFPDESIIDCPNEFLNNIYNSINHPCKPVDILFIEDKVICRDFQPVIGISINKNMSDELIDLENKETIRFEDRLITYCSIDKLSEGDINYLLNNTRDGNKLLNIIHTSINDDIDLDVDEIIE